MEAQRDAYRALVGELEGKRPHGQPRHRCKKNIKMNLIEIRWGYEPIYLAQDRDQWQALVNTVMKLQVP
jgi:hypothetical protein